MIYINDNNFIQKLEQNGWSVKSTKSGIGGSFVWFSSYIATYEQRVIKFDESNMYGNKSYIIQRKKRKRNILKLLEKYDISYSLECTKDD